MLHFFHLNAAIKWYNWLKILCYSGWYTLFPFGSPAEQQGICTSPLYTSCLAWCRGASCSYLPAGLLLLPANSTLYTRFACEPLQRGHQHAVVAVQSSYRHAVTRPCLWCLAAKSVRLQGNALAGMSTVVRALAKETWINPIKIFSFFLFILDFLKL